MAKADRLERLDVRRADLETEYRTALVAALEVTAAGSWGLLDHNPKDRAARARAEPAVTELIELAEAIDAIRLQLDLDCFALHQEFLKARGPVASSAAGEPKQARAWLERLKSDA